MSSGAPWRIFLAAEGPSDLSRLRTLVDHFLRKHAGGAQSVDELRSFQGLDGGGYGGLPYIPIKAIPELARARGLDRRYSPGGPRKGDGGTLRKLYQVLQKEKLLTPRSVVLWARDDDGDPSRREDAKEARDSLPATTPLLLAIATECGEAWVIAGWKPAPEEVKLRTWRKALGFSPQTRPWLLSHKENVPKSAKAVLADIFDGDEELEAAALIAAAESESEASRESGLHAFCEELKQWLSQARGSLGHGPAA